MAAPTVRGCPPCRALRGAAGVKALVEERGLLQISYPAVLQAIMDAALAAAPKQLEQCGGGKTTLAAGLLRRVRDLCARDLCPRVCAPAA